MRIHFLIWGFEGSAARAARAGRPGTRGETEVLVLRLLTGGQRRTFFGGPSCGSDWGESGGGALDALWLWLCLSVEWVRCEVATVRLPTPLS